MVLIPETSWRYAISAGQDLDMADENEQQHEGGLAGLAHNVVGAVEKTGDALLPDGGAQDVAHAVTGAADALVEGAATVADTVVDSAQDFVVGRAPEDSDNAEGDENAEGGDNEQGSEGEGDSADESEGDEATEGAEGSEDAEEAPGKPDTEGAEQEGQQAPFA